MTSFIIFSIIGLVTFIFLLIAMPSKLRKGCLSIMIVALLVVVALIVYITTRPSPPKPNARFHNSKEIADYYKVTIPDVALVDSDYKSMNTGAFFSEYYINTYSFTKSPSLNQKQKTVKALNNLSSVVTGDGDVEAELLEGGEKLLIKFHFVQDSPSDYNYDE